MKILFYITVVLFSASFGRAQENLALSLGASTLGATLEASYRIGPSFGVRGVVGAANGAFSTQFNGAPVRGTATIGGYGLLADVFMGGGARFSAGALSPQYGAEMSLTGSVTVDGSTFNNVDISATVSPRQQVAPVLALGYDKFYQNNWGISADLGAIYTGGFTLNAIDNSGHILPADLVSELAATNAELGQIAILPYVKLGVSFQF